MAIIVSENGKNAKRLEESQFGLEDRLQQYIYDNPDTIPLYDIDEDTRLFIAAREFNTKSGPIDALGFDASGNIYVVETKLYKNPDKRTVVAQALDYGASLWRNSIDFDDFISQLDLHCQKQFTKNFSEKYSEFFDQEDISESMDAIKSNLSEGSIKFVVLMDKLHDALKDLVIFVNQNSKFDLYAVELEYYKHKTFEIIIPKLYGTEVKKDVSSASGSKTITTSSTEEEFREDINKHLATNELTKKGADSILYLQDLYKQLAKLANGSARYSRHKTKYRDVIKLIIHDSDKRIPLYLDSDSSIGVYLGDNKGPIIDFANTLLKELINKQLMKRTEKHLQGSQWFINLKQDYATDDDIDKFLDINRKIIDSIESKTS